MFKIEFVFLPEILTIDWIEDCGISVCNSATQLVR